MVKSWFLHHSSVSSFAVRLKCTQDYSWVLIVGNYGLELATRYRPCTHHLIQDDTSSFFFLLVQLKEEVFSSSWVVYTVKQYHSIMMGPKFKRSVMLKLKLMVLSQKLPVSPRTVICKNERKMIFFGINAAPLGRRNWPLFTTQTLPLNDKKYVLILLCYVYLFRVATVIDATAADCNLIVLQVSINSIYSLT